MTDERLRTSRERLRAAIKVPASQLDVDYLLDMIELLWERITKLEKR